MEKFSVKRPFTILVLVIMIITLGVVAVRRLTTDLLPEMNLPYLIVVTPYPGASPEKVESTVAEPMERALGTISGVEDVRSANNDNYCLIQLEFEDGTDMDSAMVKVSSAVEEVSANLPDEVGTPNILEIGMDMLATMYVAVAVEDYDIYELSDFVRKDVTPYIERQNGIARVSEIGLVDRSIHVELNSDKIDKINSRILSKTNKALKDAEEKLDEAQRKVDDGKAELEEQQSSFGSTVSSSVTGAIEGTVYDISASLKVRLDSLIASVNALQSAAESLPPRVEEAEGQTVEALNEAGETTGEMQQSLDEIEAGLEGAAERLDEAGEYIENMTGGGTGEETPTPEVTPEVTPIPVPVTPVPVISPEQIAELQQAVEDLSEAAQTQAGNVAELSDQMAKASQAFAALSAAVSSIQASDTAGALAGQIAGVNESLGTARSFIDQIPALLGQAQEGVAAMTQGQLDAAVGFSTATVGLAEAEKQLEEARRLYDSEKEKALESANIDELITASTLSQLIYAQNFSMPAGYIDDKNDNSWLLKVGDEYADSAELSEVLLVDLGEDLGTVRLEDVADITVIDNAGETYTKLNGKDAICLAVYKGSTVGTHEASEAAKKAMSELEEQHPGLKMTALMDQGIYIDLIIESILRSILLGAVLAIIVLILFLRAVRPTLVVAISIPLSVLFTIVLMYFSGLSLNMMTLSGIALGIGMLVDNSIVVMENIFRLRSLGIPAARAAVQGAKQVRGAIIASTLTTICVFLPMIFTSGTVRELLIPLAISIGYCLAASLIVALTVVPASASTIMKKMKIRTPKRRSRVYSGYGKVLSFCLRFKIVPLFLAIGLLALTVMEVVRMGIVLLPEMNSNEIEVDITTDEGLEREQSYKVVNNVMDVLLTVDGVRSVGIIDGASATSLVSTMTGDTSQYGYYMSYVLADEDADADELKKMTKDMQAAVDKVKNCRVTVQAGSMTDLSAIASQSALTINIYGSELDEMKKISGEVKELIGNVKGFKNVSDGTEEGEKTLHLVIDKDKAMSYGLTVAQIYTDISSRLTTSVRSTSITVDGIDMQISIVDETDMLTRENLMDMEFTAPQQMTDAMSADAFDASGFDFDEDTDDEDADDEDGEDDKDADEASDKEDDSDDEESRTHKLSEFATVEETTSLSSINRDNQTRYITITAGIEDGENAALLTRELSGSIEEYDSNLPYGYSVEIAGQSETINDMIRQMSRLLLLGLLFIYLVMVAQFQSLLSPFVVLFTVPLAFTGGMLGLMISRQPLSMLSLMGFVILMGTVVNNGIVFVDYVNQLRIGGMERREALIAAGRTRMRPILMTAFTTILAMADLIFGKGMGSQLGSGMAIVITGGLLYATLMTLFIIPVMYDIFFRKPPLNVDVGDDLDDSFDDAAHFAAESLEGRETSTEATG